MKTLVDTALHYFRAGLEVLPNDPEEKYPKGLGGWETMPITEATIRRWWRRWPNRGIGIRNVEGLDFDNKGQPDAATLYADWCALVDELAPGLVDRLLMERTKSGGYHLVWRCKVIGGNEKLATRPPTPQELQASPKAKETALIETRGQGGQFMVAPSPGYALVRGDWCNLPTITAAERLILLDCARALHIVGPERIITGRERVNGTGPRPGDLFNEQGADEALQLLKGDGWHVVAQRGTALYLCRPGKQGGVSATFGHVAPGVLYVFSSNASPFEPETAYSPFAIKAILAHNGDYKVAARELAQRYGLDAPRSTASTATASRNSASTATASTATVAAGSGSTPAPRFVVHAERDLDQLPPIRYLDRDMQIIAGAFHLIYGASGSGKTFFALERAMRLAAEGYRCLYIATEDIQGLRYRRAAWRQAHPQASGDLLWLEMPLGIDLQSAEQVDSLITAVHPYAPDYIVIDTLREAHSGDENSSQDGARVNQAVQRLIRELGAAVDLVHHSGVAGERPRGTTALFANCDVVLKVDNDDGLARVSFEKIRNSSPREPLGFAFVPQATGLTDSDGQPVVSAILRPATQMTSRRESPLTPSQRKVLEVLALSIFADVGAKERQIVDTAQLSSRSVFRALSALKDKELVSQGVKGDPYYITREGRAALDPTYLVAPTASEDTAVLCPTASTANELPRTDRQCAVTPAQLTATATTLRGGSGSQLAETVVDPLTGEILDTVEAEPAEGYGDTAPAAQPIRTPRPVTLPAPAASSQPAPTTDPPPRDVAPAAANAPPVRIIPRQGAALRNITAESHNVAIEAELARIAAEQSSDDECS